MCASVCFSGGERSKACKSACIYVCVCVCVLLCVCLRVCVRERESERERERERGGGGGVSGQKKGRVWEGGQIWSIYVPHVLCRHDPPLHSPMQVWLCKH